MKLSQKLALLVLHFPTKGAVESAECRQFERLQFFRQASQASLGKTLTRLARGTHSVTKRFANGKWWKTGRRVCGRKPFKPS